MAGYIEDRWLKKRPNPTTGKREPTALYGKGLRYKVAGIPGVRARSFERVGDAKAWKAKAEHEQRQGEFVDPRLGLLPLAEYIEEHWWPTRDADPATLQTIRSRLGHIAALLGTQQLAHIKTPQLRAFIKELGTRVGPSTTHEIWSTLSTILQAAVDDERIRKNPCKAKTLALPKIPERKVQPWTKDRVRAVRDGLPERYQPMVDLGVGAGLRQGEVFGLAVEDIDFDAEMLHIRRQVRKIGSKLVFAPPKGGKTRDVPAPGHILRVLADHIERHPPKRVTLPWRDPTEPTTEREAKEREPRTFALLFTSTKGCALRRHGWNLWYWKAALAAAGVIPPAERVRKGQRVCPVYVEARADGFHVLRHTFASVQLHARETIVAVSSWLGHADPSITLRVYAHMMPEADGRGRRAMDKWFADF